MPGKEGERKFTTIILGEKGSERMVGITVGNYVEIDFIDSETKKKETAKGEVIDVAGFGREFGIELEDEIAFVSPPAVITDVRVVPRPEKKSKKKKKK